MAKVRKKDDQGSVKLSRAQSEENCAKKRSLHANSSRIEHDGQGSMVPFPWQLPPKLECFLAGKEVFCDINS